MSPMDNPRLLPDAPGGRTAPDSPHPRLFIALPLPAPAREELGRVLHGLQTGARFTTCRPTWARLEALHLTLAFLGPRPAEQIPQLNDALQRAAEGIGPLRIHIKQLGVFPDWRRPNVLWAGVRDRSHQLTRLAERLWGLLQPFGWVPEHRAFHPHLTLARFKSLAGISAMESIVRAHKEFLIETELTELILFRSELNPDGARHTPLERASLRPGEMGEGSGHAS